jgi:thioredoxin-related protein
MRILLIALVSSLLFSPTWEIDFQKASQSAQSEHKFILVNFSGSDWCGPCIRMHKEIFERDVFTKYANDHLILVNADFPRLKKNRLSKDQEKKNDQLADAYNKEGIFPMTLLLTADGKVLKKWEGLPKDTPEEFTNQVKTLLDASK